MPANEIISRLKNIHSGRQALRQKEAKIEEEKAAALAEIERAREAALVKFKNRSDAVQQEMLESRKEQAALEAQLRSATLRRRHEREAAESGKFNTLFSF